MAWVPIHESGITYEFVPEQDEFGSQVAVMVESSILVIPAAAYAPFIINFYGPVPRLRFRFDGPDGGYADNGSLFPASFAVSGETYANQVPVSDGQRLGWSPDPQEIAADDLATQLLYFNPQNGDGGSEAASANMLVEVWADGPEPPPGPSYNCECEEASGYRTLAELRKTMFDRLGFADPLGAVESRTLADLRADLMARLGFGAQAANPPPGMPGLLLSLINEAQQVLWRRLELDKGDQPLPPRMADDDDITVLDAPLVFALALGAGKAHYGRSDAKLYIDMAERMLADYLQRRPPNVRAMVDSFLRGAQEVLYWRHDALRTERFYRWPLQAGVRFYDLDGNDDACPRKMEPHKVTWVGVERDGTWHRLVAGIPPELYSFPHDGWPTRYEIRQCIEIWPTPDSSESYLRVKGQFGPEPFSADDDRTTIHDELVFLLALANAKEHYKQPGAQLLVQQMEGMLSNIVAGSHLTRRYVPGGRRYCPEAEPVWTAGQWPPP